MCPLPAAVTVSWAATRLGGQWYFYWRRPGLLVLEMDQVVVQEMVAMVVQETDQVVVQENQ